MLPATPNVSLIALGCCVVIVKKATVSPWVIKSARNCFNSYLLFILPFAVAGLLLVVVLFALNLTVTEGSINGLIFYANVLSMSNAVQFSEKGSRYLYTFHAWLNLDLGIPTCLFDGMDGYSETWLEFVFPAYLLMIIIAIIQEISSTCPQSLWRECCEGYSHSFALVLH